MNDLQIFQNPEFGAIRTFEIDGEAWFVGNDIARALGYSNPRDALSRHVDSDDVGNHDVIDSMGRSQSTKIINESGMYALIIMSELPAAKKFKRWITKDVIPSIVKTGGYNLPQLSQSEIVALMAQNQVELEKGLAAVQQEVQQLGGKFDTAMKTFAAPSIDHWKTDIDAKIKNMVTTYHRSPTGFRGMLYAELEDTANVLLKNRMTRLQARMKKQGATYKERMAVSKLDVISKDKQLRVIFEGIVKKYQAIYETEPP